MAYISEKALQKMGFAYLGKNVQVSDKASIYNCDEITLNDNCRIDDFCVLSGKISLGQYCHITPYCLIAGGKLGVEIGDFSTLAYRVNVFSQSDDYSGSTMVNSLIPKKFKNEQFTKIIIDKHVIIGTASTIMPGASIAEGCSVGAMSLVNEETKPWGIYVGIPAKRIKERNKDILELEKKFLMEKNNDPIQ